ncbi:hypothetical protein VNO77_18501 [Canavalia gladiata]|uniref:Sec-independent protein translocase protein TATA, chloroplastic n=1 Tax=Canavalia gladiata TaxID=3824 RepID=A0AAN9QHR8_CANGL
MEIKSCVSFWSPSSIPIAIARPNITSVGFPSSSSSSLLLNSATARVSVRDGGRRNKGLSCKALFGLGVPELVVIAGVAALVFGPKKLPEVGRSIGKTVKSFQQAAKEFESEIKKEPDSAGGGSSEKSIAASEQEKQDIEVSSSKESVSDL